MRVKNFKGDKVIYSHNIRGLSVINPRLKFCGGERWWECLGNGDQRRSSVDR